MKVLHISTSDVKGGAYRSAYRLHRALLDTGVDSRMFVQFKESFDPTVLGPSGAKAYVSSLLRTQLDALPTKLYQKEKAKHWSNGILFNRRIRQIQSLTPDIVNLHWINGGFVPVSALGRMQRPMVWTLHDMWPFTGGCHYAGDCKKYEIACGACPQLNSSLQWDLSRWSFARKVKYWSKLDFSVVAVSTWLAECARKSTLFADKEVLVIPDCLDLTRFRVVNKSEARALLGWPQDKKIVLFGAISGTRDPNKGHDLLLAALQVLEASYKHADLAVAVFGGDSSAYSVLRDISVYGLGFLSDEISQTLTYSAADLMIVPSRQEAFGMTALEALACGTPVVAFRTTGLTDIVDHQVNGFLAEPFDFRELAAGITWALSNKKLHADLCVAARAKAERCFEASAVANQFRQLYERKLAAPGRTAGAEYGPSGHVPR